MVIMHWLGQQLYLTYRQILTDITIPHLVTGSIFYVLIHKTARRGLSRAQGVERSFKSEAQALIHTHVWQRHEGHPLDCQHPDCLPDGQ